MGLHIAVRGVAVTPVSRRGCGGGSCGAGGSGACIWKVGGSSGLGLGFSAHEGQLWLGKGV